MKTYIMVLTLAAVLAVPSFARAEDHTQLRTFAVCAGRLSALMQYQWMFDGPASEQTKAQRATMFALIDAIMPSDMRPQVLQWQIAAKHAQSGLLARATFNENAQDAAWARAQADRFAQDCTGLMLS